MRLAEVCGTAKVDELLDSLTEREWQEWLAKDRIEPIGSAGVTALLATIAAFLVSKSDDPFTAEDIKRACRVDGQGWVPIEPPKQRLSEAELAGHFNTTTTETVPWHSLGTWLSGLQRALPDSTKE